MRWHQVVVKYESKGTALYVDDHLCVIEGRRTWSTTYLAKYTNKGTFCYFHMKQNRELQQMNVSATIYPPRSPKPPADPTPFNFVYIGGVPRAPKSDTNALVRFC